MDVGTWMIVISTLIAIFYYYYRKKRHDFNDWGVPQAKELPILGMVAASLIQRKHVTEIFQEIYDIKKEAKYVGMHSFFLPIVLLRDPELIKSIMVKDFDHFTHHQQFLDESLDPLMSKNLAALQVTKWHDVRGLLTPGFSSNKMKMMFELMDKSAQSFSKTLVEQYAKDPETDMKEAFAKYTTDVIATWAFGIEIDSLKDPKNEFYLYGRQLTQTEGRWKLIASLIKMHFILFCPRLAKVFKLKVLSKKISDFFLNNIEMAIKTRDMLGIERPDMLQLMMGSRDTAKVKLDIDDMTAQAFLFFMVGSETTSTQMCLMAHELACHPELQEKLLSEVDAVVEACQGKLTYKAVSNMPYLDAVFQETIRLHPQAALLVRTCTKEYELPAALPDAKPYLLKPGNQVLIPACSIQRDPAYYDEPDKFKPERYDGMKVPVSDVTNLGFGMGPRMCIGNRFAALAIRVLFCHLLRRCTLEPCAKSCVPLKYGKLKFGPQPDEGFWLKLKARELV